MTTTMPKKMRSRKRKPLVISNAEAETLMDGLYVMDREGIHFGRKDYHDARVKRLQQKLLALIER